jgi:hypothetical protein
MIAIALGVLSLVVMIATGVAASSGGDARLSFLGVNVQTTTAQVFLTGAIFGWVFVVALWLLRVGIHRSGERCAQLAARRSRRTSEWLGFTETQQDGWGGWDEWDARGRPAGRKTRGTNASGMRFRAESAYEPDDSMRDGILGGGNATRYGDLRFRAGTAYEPNDGLRNGILSETGTTRGDKWHGADTAYEPEFGLRDGMVGEIGTTHGDMWHRADAAYEPEGGLGDGIVGGTGTARHGGGAPGRPDRGADDADRALAIAPDQPGPLGGGHPPGPVAGHVPGVGMDGGAERREIGGGAGPVPGEDRGAEGEYRSGESRQ